ncbi:uncharacterized protein LOC134192844 [Corticium candelabrum]|uniref:uncharacterized protein LOC134192844 n=1 Tax=Corticium candelabrum TaxID=121492 RepID=UPI002E25FCFE|nr:uncharacterized protein LOC134192844 [Corticium candelabrum]
MASDYSLQQTLDWEIRDKIVIGEELGRGSYGTVCEGEWKGARVAVKTVHDIFVEVGLPRNDVAAFLEKFELEWQTMKYLRHPNVVQLFGVSTLNSKQPKMIMEMLDESLQRRLEGTNPLSPMKKLHVLKGIACGLRYLHELPCPVIHRDLSSKNILLSDDARHVKIGDLGVAKVLSEMHCARGTVMPGTELYMPPETRSETLPHPSLDIFSFGVIMIETIVNCLPSPLPLLTRDPNDSTKYCVLTELERREKDLKQVPKDHILYSTICAALDLPENRPSAAEILESLSKYKQKIGGSDDKHHSSELQQCKLKVDELVASKERMQSEIGQLKTQVLKLQDENKQLRFEATAMKAANLLPQLQTSETSNLSQYPVNQPDVGNRLKITETQTPHHASEPVEFIQLPLLMPTTNEQSSRLVLPKIRSERVDVDSDIIKYVTTLDNAVGALLSLNHRVTDDFNYYEVCIISSGHRGTIGVGFARNNYRLNRQPGWDCGSVAYHCDDGMVYSGSGGRDRLQQPSKSGDVIGCGINRISGSDPNCAVAFFTRNGILIGQKAVSIPEGGFYPMVGMHSRGEIVRVNFSATWCNESTHLPVNSIIPSLSVRYERIDVDGDMISYAAGAGDEVAVYQMMGCRMDSHFSYYVVRIVKYGTQGTIAIGLARRNYSLNRQPGWDSGSIGYHCDDGIVYHTLSDNDQCYGCAQEGDLIGCGISKFVAPNEQQAIIIFTKNGIKMGEVKVDVPQGGLYPTVGLHSVGEVIQVDLTATYCESTFQTESIKLNTPASPHSVIPPPYFSLYPTAPRSIRSQLVEVTGNTVSYTKHVTNDVGVFQSLSHQIGMNFFYFEVRIVNYGAEGYIGVGLAGDNYPLNCQPGWERGSIGYHCDDGKLYYETGFGQPFHQPAQEGDVIGCGVHNIIQSKKSPTAVVFFTRNDMKLGEITVPIPEGGFYPTVGLHSRGEVIEVDFQSKWRDITQHKQDIRHERVLVVGNDISYIDTRMNDVGVYQLTGHTMSSSFVYYEVTVVKRGRKGTIAVGLAHPEYSLAKQPGWETGSVAYHCDDGKLYCESSFGKACHTPANEGDVIGCGISSFSESSRQLTVFFTQNGRKFGEILVAVPRGGLCPTVGLHSAGEVVKVNTNAKWKRPVITPCRYERVEVNGKRLWYVGNARNDVGVYQAINHPMNSQQSYYEVHIISTGARGTIAVGVAAKSYSLDQQPGWLKGSVAYHCDDGKLYKESGQGMRFHHAARSGDLIGCGINLFKGSFSKQATVFFTHNGVKIGETVITVPRGGFYPTVGLHSRDEVVQIETGAQWPKDSRYRIETVHVDGNRISYIENKRREMGCYQVLEKHMDQEGSCFEVEIVNYGTHGYIGIGIARRDYPLDEMPGWKPGSIAYHCDDGKLFQGTGIGKMFSSPATQGDVIGCGVNKVVHSDSKTMEVYFIKNGTMMGTGVIGISEGGFSPIVGFHTENGSVKPNVQSPTVALTTHPQFRYSNVQIEATRLSYAGNQGNQPIGLCQFISRKMDEHFNYFEMTIVSAGIDGASGIGVTRKGYPLDAMPGWQEGSYGFHGDDGHLFYGNSGKGHELSTPVEVGEVVGCGLNFSQEPPKLFFTRNGQKLIQFAIDFPEDGLYATVGMHNAGEAVDLNVSVNWLGHD